MMCPVCGRDNEERSQFCVFCGNSLAGITPYTPNHYGMISFPDAVRLGFQRYFDFRSRSTRAEHWWWLLFVIIADLILTVFDIMNGTYNAQSGNGVFSGLFGLAMLIPSFALGARRLHDINRSGWWQLMWIGFFLIIPAIILLWWATKPSDQGTNKHGPSPRQDTLNNH